jgi:hypothetical protein
VSLRDPKTGKGGQKFAEPGHMECQGLLGVWVGALEQRTAVSLL